MLPGGTRELRLNAGRGQPNVRFFPLVDGRHCALDSYTLSRHAHPHIRTRRLQPNLEFKAVKGISVGEELLRSYDPGKDYVAGDFTALSLALLAARAAQKTPSSYLTQM